MRRVGLFTLVLEGKRGRLALALEPGAEIDTSAKNESPPPPPGLLIVVEVVEVVVVIVIAIVLALPPPTLPPPPLRLGHLYLCIPTYKFCGN